MFRGRYEHAIDGKGRTSLPSRFRDVLAESGDSRIVLTNAFQPHLVAYPLVEWEAFEKRLRALPQFDESVANVKRHYVANAVDCEIDKLGRLLIPANLRQHAGLDREATWAGVGTHIELWDTARFDSVRTSVLSDEAKREAMMRRLAELGL